MRIVFDLDGTLVDSAPDLMNAANQMLAMVGKAPLSPSETISFVGNGLP
ncbi:MAG: HAD hydrolase-like protein, partial [Maritimibacter sp.]